MELPNNFFKPAPKPDAGQPLQGGDVIVPGAASNSSQPGIHPNQKHNDKAQHDDAEAEADASKDNRGNTANQPPKKDVGAPKNGPVRKY